MKRLLVLLGILFASVCHPNAAETKPVLLYSRYFNAEGENRYEADGTYKHFIGLLRESFEVKVNDEPLTAEHLRGVSVVLVANPSDKAAGENPPPHHCSPEDVAAINAFVRGGGGFIAMANQEAHNLDVKGFNTLLGTFGMQWEDRYTDAKKLVIPESVPILGGLRWAYYTGDSIAIEADHEAKPRALVRNDLTQKPIKGTRDAEGALLAVAEPGKGRVVTVTDSGWLTDSIFQGPGIGGVMIEEHDNFEIFLRLARWAAGKP